MSYCRWSDGDLYAYQGTDGYHVYVAARRQDAGIRAHYREDSAHALMARVLWLGSKGCDYPWDALRYLRDDIIKAVEAAEADDASPAPLPMREA